MPQTLNIGSERKFESIIPVIAACLAAGAIGVYSLKLMHKKETEEFQRRKVELAKI